MFRRVTSNCNSEQFSESSTEGLHKQHNKERHDIGDNLLGRFVWGAIRIAQRPGRAGIDEIGNLSDAIVNRFVGLNNRSAFFENVKLPEEIESNLRSDSPLGVIVFGNHETKLEPPFVLSALKASLKTLKSREREINVADEIKILGLNLFASGIQGLDELLISVIPKPLASDYQGKNRRGILWKLTHKPFFRKVTAAQVDCFNARAKELIKRYVLDEHKIIVMFPTASRDIMQAENWQLAGTLANVIRSVIEAQEEVQREPRDFYLLPFQLDFTNIDAKSWIRPSSDSNAELKWHKPIKASEFIKNFNLTVDSSDDDIKQALFQYYSRGLEAE